MSLGVVDQIFDTDLDHYTDADAQQEKFNYQFDQRKKELIVIPLSLIDDPRVMNLKYTFHPISVYTKSSTQHLGS